MRLTQKTVSLLAFVTLASSASFGYLAERGTERKIVEGIQAQFDALAQTQENRLTRFVDDSFVQLGLIADRLARPTDDYLRNGSAAAGELEGELGASSLSSKSFVSLALLGPDGHAFVSTDASLLGVAVEPSGAGALARLIRIEPDAAGAPQVHLLGPVARQGRTLAVLRIVEKGGELLSITQDHTGLGRTGEIILGQKDADGRIRFLTPLREDPQAALDRTLSADDDLNPLVRAVAGEERFMTDAVNDQGHPAFASTRHVDATGWGVVVSMDRTEALQPISELRNEFLVTGLAAAAAFILLGIVVARVVIGDVQRLSQAAQRIRKGDLSVRAEVRANDELGELATAFNGMADQLIRSNQDLEARVEAKTALLAQREEQFRAITETANDGIVSADAVGNITLFNPTAERLFGQTAGNVIGQPLTVLMPDRFREAHLEGLARFLATGESQVIGRTVEFVGLRRDGSEFPVELSISTWTTSDGRFFTGIVRDVTERRHAEEAANAAREAAEAATRAKSEFLANMSHEIRTPMNAIVGMTDLLAETDLAAEQREFVDTVRASSAHLLAVINDILDFSKIEAGKFEIEAEPLDVRRVLASSLDLVAGAATAKGLRLVHEVDAAVPLIVAGDRTRLQQVLVNLLSNAVKFTDQGEVAVTVTARKVDGQWDLGFAVRDTGIGIPKDRFHRLFQSFSQVDSSTTREHGGTGLGLAISRRLVELMGGTIEVESEVGVGSTFRFTVRVEERPGEDLADVDAGRLRGKRLLIVADPEGDVRALAALARRWGLTARTTGASEEGLSWLRRGDPFDVVLVDDALLRAKTATFVRAAQAIPGRASLPFALIASHHGSARATSGLFQATLNQPVRQSELFNVLNRLAGEHPTAPAPPPSGAAAQQLRILLAEDNLLNQKVAQRILERQGFRADAVSNGRKAIDALMHAPYDLVLMDVQMPVMDGFQATREIHRLWPPERRPYIVAMTAHAMEGDREACLAAGMDDYLTKPINVDALMDVVRRVQTRRPILPLRRENDGGQGPATAPADGNAIDAEAFAQLKEDFGDADLEELLATFRDESARLVATLSAAAAAKDAKGVEQAAHALKSSSALVGASALSSLCAEAETAGRVGDAAATARLAPRIAEAFEAALRDPRLHRPV